MLPPHLRKKAANLYANKAAIVSRIDLLRQSSNGEGGMKFEEQIQKQIDIWQAPPPVKAIKALPAPVDIQSKRRGGKRLRKMKERNGVTDLRKRANRMEFCGIDESYDNETSVNAGQLGKTNRIRAVVVDAKTNARVSKMLNQKLLKQDQKQRAILGGTTTMKKISGTATSVSFTPLTGVEISNPVQLENKPQTSSKYFSNI